MSLAMDEITAQITESLGTDLANALATVNLYMDTAVDMDMFMANVFTDTLPRLRTWLRPSPWIRPRCCSPPTPKSRL